MKKILPLAAIVLLSVVTPQAQTITGYEKSIDVGYLVGIGERKNNIIGLSMVNGYRFNSIFFTGLGVGVGYSNTLSRIEESNILYIPVIVETRYNSILIPVYANIKANLSKDTKVSPFLSLNLGYTFDALSSKAPGLMLQPNFGIDFNISDKNTAYFLIGFNLQRFSYYYQHSSYWAITTKTEMFKSIDLRAGIKF